MRQMYFYDFMEYNEEAIAEAKDFMALMSHFNEIIQANQIINKDGEKYYLYEGKVYNQWKMARTVAECQKLYADKYIRVWKYLDIFEEHGYYCISSFYKDYEETYSLYSFSDFYNTKPRENEKHILMDGKQTVEVGAFGLICYDSELKKTMFYELSELTNILSNGKFITDNEEYERIYMSKWGRRTKRLVHIDGVRDNYLSSNLATFSKYDREIKYSRGYCSNQVNGRKHHSFRISNKGTEGIFETEIEAAYTKARSENHMRFSMRLENGNILLNNVYVKRSFTEYIRGNLTELGLWKEKLKVIAENPFLVLRYNLCSCCVSLNVIISPFKMDENGYMTNFNGVRYSDLADCFARGWLTAGEIANQFYIKSMSELSCYDEWKRYYKKFFSYEYYNI